MKKLLTALLFITVVSCNTPMEKPFVITQKYVSHDGSNICLYYYKDKTGRSYDFRDWNDKYNVGDTIGNFR